MRSAPKTRGFFEIGIYRSKNKENLGTLWRTAYQMGATGVFVIGQRYKHQSSDTVKSWRHIPLRQFDTFEEFNTARPHAVPLVAIEMGGKPLGTFVHPPNAVYLLGSEDNGIPPAVLRECQSVVSLPHVRTESFNVAIAGGIVLYDRLMQRGGAQP